ncbi:Palmitoyltransferase [Dinochytrium kinnereticum]|nr:Palmitoyltransferase [Dinochytrium kinnereticum]
MYALFLIGWRMWDLIKYQEYIGSQHLPHAGYFYTPPASNSELIAMVINLILLFILMFTVGILSIWQLYFVTCNTTTIENSENTKIQELIRKDKVSSDATYPYDLGMLRNLKAVFGQNIFLWWLPQAAEGDGLSFDVDPALLEGDDDILWPPPEYYENNRKRTHTHSKKSTKHVRRGSEGYLVKEWTLEERERMVADAERRAINGEHESDSDNETLALKQERYRLRNGESIGEDSPDEVVLHGLRSRKNTINEQ